MQICILELIFEIEKSNNITILKSYRYALVLVFKIELKFVAKNQ